MRDGLAQLAAAARLYGEIVDRVDEAPAGTPDIDQRYDRVRKDCDALRGLMRTIRRCRAGRLSRDALISDCKRLADIMLDALELRGLPTAEAPYVDLFSGKWIGPGRRGNVHIYPRRIPTGSRTERDERQMVLNRIRLSPGITLNGILRIVSIRTERVSEICRELEAKKWIRIKSGARGARCHFATVEVES